MSGGKISTTKLSFTLPISCQICLEKVKEPVTCPNQHVFCSLCMEVWLERNKQCPTCRVDITPQSPVRRIIGGMPHTQNEENRSPRTSKNLRRARMELLFRDYENEISELQREVVCLQHSKEELKSRLEEEERKSSSGAHSGARTSSACSRCGNMQDIDSMLEMAKNLQEATKTFEEMKEENEKLKHMNEKLQKEYDDLKRHNISVREELNMRSPMKFGRLTVATLESRIEAYGKQVTQLQKALEKNDKYTESLQEQLNSCTCKHETKSDITEMKTLSMSQADFSHNKNTSNKSHATYLLEHDYLPYSEEESSVDHAGKVTGVDVSDNATTYYTIENILPDDLVSQAFNVATNEDSLDQNAFSNQTNSSKSPFTPSTKFSKLSLTTSTSNTIRTEFPEGISLNSIKIQSCKDVSGSKSTKKQEEIQQPIIQTSPKEHDVRARSFTAYAMPPVESPDYKEKLEQIQDNLLHPITASSSSVASPGSQVKSFSRRLTFDDGLHSGNQPESFDLNFLEENTESSCADEMMSLLQSEDSMQSIDQDADMKRSADDIRFIRPQSVMKCKDTYIHSGSELADCSSNPVLSSGHYSSEQNTRQKQSSELQCKASLSVVDAGGTRITTTKLSQSDQDIFTRPSSAPSRTFLLSGSRFSALRPLDPPLGDASELSQFQPVKCKSPSPLSMQRRFTTPQARNSFPPKKEGIRCVVDGRSDSPLLRLVSPDEVISKNWKQSTISSSEEPSGHAGSSGSQKSKDTISRVAILKRNNSLGKPSAHTSSTLFPIPLLSEDPGPTPPRRSSRKQCLSDQNKRMGDHSPEFVSPVKTPKMDRRNWK